MIFAAIDLLVSASCHRSRDHLILQMQFPITVPLPPQSINKSVSPAVVEIMGPNYIDLDLSGSRDVIGHVTI